MWLDYLKERFGYQTIEKEWGFVCYTIALPFLCIQEVYVKPEFRRSTKGLTVLPTLAEIGDQHGCSHFWSQVCIEDRGHSKALRVNLAYGFQVISADGGCIIMTRKIKE